MSVLACPGVISNGGEVTVVNMLPCPVAYPPIPNSDVASGPDFGLDPTILIYNW